MSHTAPQVKTQSHTHSHALVSFKFFFYKIPLAGNLAGETPNDKQIQTPYETTV